ncbi:Lin0512 family protein [Candidatus Puniceispirillum sp.]|uniref:Lin0512 family protein n=1 Tax=Candidatus Puniceispirillum sp. TaxID=2026719 RepID=UPI003F69C6FF
MAITRVAMELGMGTSLRAEDYTKAAVRALKDALWHNSLSMADAFGFPRDAMIVDIEIAVQKPDAVDADAVKAVLPYGNGAVKVVKGGLDVPKPDGAGKTIIANAAVLVSFDMERRQVTAIQPEAGR